jgi:hypothetical protein
MAFPLHMIVPPLSSADHPFKTRPKSLTLRPTPSLAVLGLPHRRSKEKERRRETKLIFNVFLYQYNDIKKTLKKYIKILFLHTFKLK